MRNDVYGAGQRGPHTYPAHREADVRGAISEAWAWLENQGLVVPSPENFTGSSEQRILSRRAMTLKTEGDFRKFTTARWLPKELLHPRLVEKVWIAFIRGDFDIAVLLAMKAVEVRVRETGGYGGDLLGVKLMRTAFHPETGALTDKEAESGERQARADLFAGAIGSYKNPQSHRDVNLDDPVEATELILLANHLLRIVDARVGG